jgi:hypothetical protein
MIAAKESCAYFLGYGCFRSLSTLFAMKEIITTFATIDWLYTFSVTLSTMPWRRLRKTYTSPAFSLLELFFTRLCGYRAKVLKG